MAEVSARTDKLGVAHVGIKLHDKIRALEALAKYYKLFQDIIVNQDNREQTLEIVVVTEDGSRYRYNPATPRATIGLEPAPGQEEDRPGGPALGENHRDSDSSG